MSKINDREKKLILLLIIAIIVFLPYFFFIQPTLEKNSVLTIRLDELRATKTQLDQWAANASTYREEMEEMERNTQEIFGKFPSELPQEATILFIQETERQVPILLYQIGFGEDVAAQITSEAEEEAIREVEEATGMESDEAILEDTTTSTSLGDGLESTSTTTQIAFRTTYEGFKEFLNYVMTYKDRIVIYDLDASYSEEMQVVNGSFAMIQYAISGPGQEAVQVTPPDMMKGTGNIFMEASGSFSDTVEAEPSDFFVLLNQPDAANDAKVVGRSNDVEQTTYLVSDDNNEQEITILFEGEDGEYTADYSIGNDSHEGDEIVFNKTGPIYLEIISSPRQDEDDDVAASFNIINRTDQAVYFSRSGDDPDNPRVNIMGVTGSVLER